MSGDDFDTVAFLLVAVLGGLFAVIELAGERLAGFHTISYWSSVHPWLRRLVIGAFLAGGIGGAVWFHFHACAGCIVR